MVTLLTDKKIGSTPYKTLIQKTQKSKALTLERVTIESHKK